MAEKDSPGPSLELPSLFDRRKKRRSEAVEPEPASRASQPTPPPADRASQPTPPTADRASQPSAAPVQRTAPVHSDVTQTRPTADSTTTTGTADIRRSDTRTEQVAEVRQDRGSEHGADDTDESSERRGPTLPDVGVAVAALGVGAVVGLLGVVLTFLGLKGCELVTGTDSCGGPGLLVLVAILVAMVLAGGALLRLLGVPDAGSVSFLGVGVLTVVVLVLLLDVLLSPVMIVVVPILTAGCYGLARWITTQLAEDVMADR